MSDKPVGYRNPPKHTQFKKGQSGNPKGRPKGSTNLRELANKLLSKPVTVTRNGKATKVPVIEVIMTKLISMAANGDHKATKTLFDLLGASSPESKAASIVEAMAGCPSFDLSPEDLAALSKAKLLKGVS